MKTSSCVVFLALGLFVEVISISNNNNNGGQWQPSFGFGQREPLRKQWQSVQNTFGQALQSLLKILPSSSSTANSESGYGIPQSKEKPEIDIDIKAAVPGKSFYFPAESSKKQKEFGLPSSNGGYPSSDGYSSGGYSSPSSNGGYSSNSYRDQVDIVPAVSLDTSSANYQNLAALALKVARPNGGRQDYSAPSPPNVPSNSYGPVPSTPNVPSSSYGSVAEASLSQEEDPLGSYGPVSGTGVSSDYQEPASYGIPPVETTSQGGYPASQGGYDTAPQKPQAPLPPREIYVDATSLYPPPQYNPPQQQQQPQEPDHVNIIFAKVPLPPQYQTEIIVPPPAPSQTKVFVLTKDAENEDNIRIVEPPKKPHPKPEVFFIRYAQNAPKEITNPFNKALDYDKIPPLPQNFDTYAPEMASGYSYKKREVREASSEEEIEQKPRTVYIVKRIVQQ